ncbi:hypothetical protein ACJBQV_10335, partial [Streptococcus suis]
RIAIITIMPPKISIFRSLGAVERSHSRRRVPLTPLKVNHAGGLPPRRRRRNTKKMLAFFLPHATMPKF